MLKIIITGAAGRMGRRLVTHVVEDNDLQLIGATEYPGSPYIGQDAGAVAGVGELNIPILEDMDIARILSEESDLEEACKRLVSEALYGGSTDNISVALILNEV